jgi:hypothetical protein
MGVESFVRDQSITASISEANRLKDLAQEVTFKRIVLLGLTRVRAWVVNGLDAVINNQTLEITDKER